MKKAITTLVFVLFIFALSQSVPAAESAETPKVKTLYTFVGVSNDQIIMECYNDDTCAIIEIGKGVITKGTWILDESCQTPEWWIKLDDVFEGLKIRVDTDYTTKYSFVFKDVSGQLEEMLWIPFTAV